MESQNITKEELVLLTTRICNNAKMIFTSDVNQIDLFDKKKSAGHYFEKISRLIGVGLFELKHNYRHPLAQEIFELLSEG